MKVAILIYSKTGNTIAAAQLIEQGIQSAGDIQTRIISVENEEQDFIKEASAVVFGTPTYSANFAWPLKRWFDERARHCNLPGKLAANFATGDHIGGGEDSALASMASHELVRGMLVYSGGGPLTHVGAVVIGKGDEFQQKRAIEFGARIGKKVLELFSD
jgi:NAD(P)H dehydrogenase (quinone)